MFYTTKLNESFEKLSFCFTFFLHYTVYNSWVQHTNPMQKNSQKFFFGEGCEVRNERKKTVKPNLSKEKTAGKKHKERIVRMRHIPNSAQMNGETGIPRCCCMYLEKILNRVMFSFHFFHFVFNHTHKTTD